MTIRALALLLFVCVAPSCVDAVMGSDDAASGMCKLESPPTIMSFQKCADGTYRCTDITGKVPFADCWYDDGEHPSVYCVDVCPSI